MLLKGSDEGYLLRGIWYWRVFECKRGVKTEVYDGSNRFDKIRLKELEAKPK